MTRKFFEPEPKHSKWFKKEQGRFLKKARLRAGLSVKDIRVRTGVDIRWVESGQVNLQMRNLAYLIRLYRVPEDYFMAWQHFITFKLRQMAPPKILH